MTVPMFRKISTITMLAMAMFFATIANAQNGIFERNINYNERPTPWEKLEKVLELNHVDTRYISVLDYPDSSTLDTINRYLWKELGLQQQVTFTEDITYGEILCISMAVKYAGNNSIDAQYQRCRYSINTKDYIDFSNHLKHIDSTNKKILEDMRYKYKILNSYYNWCKSLGDNTCDFINGYYYYDAKNSNQKWNTDSLILLIEGFEQIEREIDLYNGFTEKKYNADFTSFGPDSLEIKNNCAKILWKKAVAENSIAKTRTFAHAFPESDKAKQIPTKIKKLTASFQTDNESQERHRSLARQCYKMRQRGDSVSKGYKTNMAEMRKIEDSYWKSITGSYMRSYNPYPADVISFLKKYPAGYYSDTASILLKKMYFSAADSNKGILFLGNISKNFLKEPEGIDSVIVIIIDSVGGDTVSKWSLNRGETKSYKLSPGVYYIKRIFYDMDTNPGPVKQIKNFVSEKDPSLNIVRPTQCEITTKVEVTPHSFHKYVFFRYPIRDSGAGVKKLYQTYADAKVHAEVRKQLQAKRAEEYEMFMDELKALKDNYLQTK